MIMTENKETSITVTIRWKSMGKCMLVGASIAFVLIAIFIAPVVLKPNPDWSPLWFIRPLIVVPFAGAMGGVFYYLMSSVRQQGGWKKALALVASFIVYVIGLWMGTVLGLVGTLWH
jgi:hypothetical protein